MCKGICVFVLLYVCIACACLFLFEKNLNEYDLKDLGPRKSLIYSSHTNPKCLESKSQPRETQPENGKGALGVDTLSPILGPREKPMNPETRTKRTP